VFLLWPAAALGIVAAGYFGLGPGIFRKADGRLPPSTRLALLPVLVGHHLSVRYYRRRCHAWDILAPTVWIGRRLSSAEAGAAVAQGVAAVLDLTAEFSEPAPLLALNYRNLPILDVTAPTQDQLQEAVAFLRDQTATGVVYVHCKIGFSRTAAVAAAYLLATGECPTVEDALARLRAVRPAIIVRPEVVEALRVFARAAGAARKTQPPALLLDAPAGTRLDPGTA
jgi:hypothetical protein